MKPSRGIVLLLTLAAFACGRPEDQETGSLDAQGAMQEREEMPPELRARLDSGYAAFAAEDAQAALEHYQAATEMDPETPAAWFGVYIAHRALGNTGEAAAALQRAQELAPGATLIHPSGEDTIR